jgi:hypothetical protein
MMSETLHDNNLDSTLPAVLGANPFEDQLLMERQRSFLEQAFPDSFGDIPDENYRTTFLLLPYLLKDIADDPRPRIGLHNIDSGLYRLYRWMRGEPFTAIAKDEGVVPGSLYQSRQRLAEWLGKSTSIENVLKVTELVDTEKV